MRVITIGTFDLLHAGHRELFAYGAEINGGAGVYVGVNSSVFVRTYKGEPAQSTRTRLTAVRTERNVYHAVIHTGATLATIHALSSGRPSLLLIGSDWHGRDYLTQLGVTWDELKAVGVIGIVYAHRPSDGPSSTKLRGPLLADFDEEATVYAMPPLKWSAEFTMFGDPDAYAEFDRVLSYSETETEEIDGCRD